MDPLIEQAIKLAADAANDAWRAGFAQGYREGAKWALDEAMKILTGKKNPESSTQTPP